MSDYEHNPLFLSCDYGSDLMFNEAGDVIYLRRRKSPVRLFRFDVIAAVAAIAFVLGLTFGALT